MGERVTICELRPRDGLQMAKTRKPTEIKLAADTVGYANPGQIREVVRVVQAVTGGRLERLHLHDTMGPGLANALAGLPRTFKVAA